MSVEVIKAKISDKQICTEGKLSDIQLRNMKMLPYHMAVDNVYASNLINDITYVNYTEDSKGLTHLRPLRGLPMFIDDLYLYMYIHEEQIEKIGNAGKVIFKGGEGGAISNIGKKLAAITNEVFGAKCRQKVVFSLNLSNNERKVGNIIFQTVMRIRTRGGDRAWVGFCKYYGDNTKPVALIKYKIDTSILPFQTVLDGLPSLERRLNQLGAGLMSIDYTQDFSGVLERVSLENYLIEKKGFTRNDDGDYRSDENLFITPTIVNCEKESGRNIVKYVKSVGSMTCVVKYYN